MSSAPALAVGTRRSGLARAQTGHVIALLEAAWPGLRCETVLLDTTGDRTQAAGLPLPEVGGKGLFTAELEDALRRGRIDAAVHSLKDLPTEDAPALVVGAVCSREDARDVLVSAVGGTLATLPAGAVVGTSSPRRAAQILASRPDLDVRPIRGNVDTRVRKVRQGAYDAAVLAAAGLRRLGLEGEIAEWLLPDVMLPAPGQGALAVQCRAGDERVLELLLAIDDAAARAATDAERDFLRALGGGCSAPVGAYAEASEQGVRLRGIVASRDGQLVVRVEGEGPAREVGNELARDALARGAGRLVRRSLAGRCVVVTRRPEQAAELVAMLESLGAAVVSLPLIRVEPVGERRLDQLLRDVSRYDLLVFTSANAVGVVAARLSALGVSPADAPPVAAVGPVTAEAARVAGLDPVHVPETFLAEEIVRGLGDLRGRRVLLPQAERVSGDLAELLEEAGARVDASAVYRTVAVEPVPDELASVAGADAILLASGSAARSLAQAVGADPDLRAAVDGAALVCIGPRTADAAREVGLTVRGVAVRHTAEGLVDALVDALEETERPTP